MINYNGKVIRGLASTKLTLILPVAIFIAFITLMADGALAQDSNGPWGEPENLSLSANASNPLSVVDSSGTIHVIWQDATYDFMYANQKDGVWSEAIPVEMPFGTRRYYPQLTERQRTPLHVPVLWADDEDGINALWSDEEQRLFYSNVPAAEFAEFGAWKAPRELAPSSPGATGVADSNGRIHVVYISPGSADQSSAGLYYTNSVDNGTSWSSPMMLYESPYFRSLAVGLANLQVVAQSKNTVIVAWDDPFLERVYVVKSDDSGQSWEPPLEVDRRLEEDGAEAIGPNGIQVAATEGQIHLFWQAGHEAHLCSEFHQFTIDGGTTWQPAERLRSEFETCPNSIMLIAGGGDTIVFVGLTESHGRVTAWDGARWGEVQNHTELARFLNPLNYREVILSCHQAVTGTAAEDGPAGSALVLGCDTGPGGDIWTRSVDLDQLIFTLAPQATPVWQHAQLVSEDSANGDSLQLLSDADGWLHAFWQQPILDVDSRNSVRYSRWDGISWSQAKNVLDSSDGPAVEQAMFTLSPDDKIMAVWVDEVPGNVYFSQADLAKAGNSAEWSSPKLLPMTEAEAASPVIYVDRDGIIYVAYAVLLNEGRGIYLTQSGDDGEAWLGPVQVFNGASAGWSMVDSPRLAIGSDGTLHLLWTRLSPPPNSRPVSIHYARSVDGGASWSDAVEVAQSLGTWTELLATGDLAVHRFWLADNNDIWHQVSIDGGITWEQPQRVSSYAEALASAHGVLDGAGRPWLLQAAGTRADNDEIRGPSEIRTWVLSDGRWTASDVLNIGDMDMTSFAAAATSGGEIEVVFIAASNDPGEDQQVQKIFHSSRSLDLPQEQPTALPTLTPTPLPEATVTPTPVPMPTATTSFPTQPGQSDGLPLPIDTTNPLAGPALGIVPAAAIVLVAFFIGVRLLRGDRRR